MNKVYSNQEAVGLVASVFVYCICVGLTILGVVYVVRYSKWLDLTYITLAIFFLTLAVAWFKVARRGWKS